MVRLPGADRNTAGDRRQVHRDTVRVLALPDVRKRFEGLGLDVIGSSPAEFAEVIKTEIPYWAKSSRKPGIKAE